MDDYQRGYREAISQAVDAITADEEIEVDAATRAINVIIRLQSAEKRAPRS